jgi:hypothetical protein
MTLCTCGRLMFRRTTHGPLVCLDCDHAPAVTVDRRYVWPTLPLTPGDPLRDSAIRTAGGLINLEYPTN